MPSNLWKPLVHIEFISMIRQYIYYTVYTKYLNFGPCKVIHALLGFRIPLLGFQIPLFGFRIPLLGFRILLLGFRIPDPSWIPDSRKLAQDKDSGFLRCLDSGFHCLDSGLQYTKSRILNSWII